jgi:VIT1/CCC1 family predicted Fe2+/Mn2+ transporter
MPSPNDHGPTPILDPLDRNAEILFGLFMCLTFTGTLSVATAGREDVRTMMIAAIGCNAAWGLVDGVMSILRSLVARGRRAHVGRAVRRASNAAEGRALIADELDPLFVRAVGEDGVERIRSAVIAAPEPPARPRLQWREVRTAIAIFFLVFLSTFPVVLPFVFIHEIQAAKRVSAAVAIVLLFACGYTWGKYAGQSPLRVGAVMVLLGLVIEAVVIALGG